MSAVDYRLIVIYERHATDKTPGALPTNPHLPGKIAFKRLDGDRILLQSDMLVPGSSLERLGTFGTSTVDESMTADWGGRVGMLDPSPCFSHSRNLLHCVCHETSRAYKLYV